MGNDQLAKQFMESVDILRAKYGVDESEEIPYSLIVNAFFNDDLSMIDDYLDGYPVYFKLSDSNPPFGWIRDDPNDEHFDFSPDHTFIYIQYIVD